MKKILSIIFICSLGNVLAQNVQKEINDQVWKPFIKTFNDHDTEGFMALHSKDVVRSSRDSNMVWNWDEYFREQQRGDKQEKSAGMKRQLDLHFTERIANKDQAVDVGIYKTTSIRSDGTSRSFYGKFLVVLRRESGTWKILVDTDSSERNTISEKDFLAASPLE